MMKTLTEYTDAEYIDGNINEGLLDWFLNLFKRSKSNYEIATKRGILPFKDVTAEDIKMTKKPIDSLNTFKKAIKENAHAFVNTGKILNSLKRWENVNNESISEKAMQFITFAYKPKESFKNEIYTCAVVGYLNPKELVVDKTKQHILFFEGDEDIISNWKQISSEVFTGFVEKVIKPKAGDKISMYYIGAVAGLPKYQGKSFEELSNRKDPVAILEV